MVVGVSDEKARSSLGEFGEHAKLVGVEVGATEKERVITPGQQTLTCHPEAVEGLLEEGILTDSGLPAEALAAVGTGEQARWQGHRVADGERMVMGCKRKELLPEALFDLPEVGSSAAEGSPVYLAEGREPFSTVTTKEEVDALVGVEPQELAYDDLYGKHFGVGELGGESAASDAPLFKLVVDEAEDGHDEGALRSIRRRPPFVLDGSEHHRG